MIKVIYKITCLLAITSMWIACSKKEDDKPPAPAAADITIKDLPAGEKSGNPANAKKDTLFFSFSLKNKTTATGPWNIAFTGIFNSTVIVNTAANAWMDLADMQYDRVTTAPPLGYNMVSIGVEDDARRGWFRYNMTTHIATTISGRTIFVKLADRSVYKVEMKSIYLGSPANPDTNTPAPFLNFRYALLP